MDEENKVVVTYSITRYENGDVAIENIETEGVEALPQESLYKDIEDLAESLKMKRVEAAAYRAMHRFYKDMANIAAKKNTDEE